MAARLTTTTTSTSWPGLPGCERTSKPYAIRTINVAPEDRDVWDIGAFAGATHVTKPERDAFNSLIEWGLVDVFRSQYPDQDGLFTYYDYTKGRFHKREGMRIDFILASEPLASTTQWSIADRNARKGEKPSDHLPLMADFEFAGA